MSAIQISLPGGYRFIPGVQQYSAGVAAEPGFRIERVRFQEPLPLKQGFQRIREILEEASRPLAAFCACELRSPAPFTEQGFVEFNNLYVGTLKEWGLFIGHLNPVARSNVCPAVSPPSEPSFHAFSYTVPDATAAASFVVAGSAEAPEGKGHYRDHAVGLGDTSPPAILKKARWVLDEMERRLASLGFTWASTTGSQLYTVHDIHPFIADEIVKRGAARHGLTWHYNRPPVVDLEYEMDCRSIAYERVAT
ncbi:2-amino-5-chloromuconate deaminase CnbZ [Variovorax sp. LT1R20]|uniref:2-amino-5-chloromuconate deaminase CnbZ n=1 Tax=Variovorax sp. LT1R20 TaxID=3443729 RepID=UPI003F453506